jgi:MbtH protein
MKEKRLSKEEKEDNTIYKVVVNREEQYSIWPADRSGPKSECLAYIRRSGPICGHSVSGKRWMNKEKKHSSTRITFGVLATGTI